MDILTLYENLSKLTQHSEVFYKIEHEYDGYIIQTFSYKLASYSDWLSECSLESRGISFMRDTHENLSIFARPFEKFFNYEENPFTDKLLVSQLTPTSITEKTDGSLIMVGKLPNGKLLAKTKSTPYSDQAIRATEIINNNNLYKDFCNDWIDKGYTVLAEYVAPTNQIVLFYPEEKLVLLALRNMLTGEYHSVHELKECPFEIVKKYNISLEDVAKLQETASGREGFVIVFDNGQRMKFKTLDYIKKHRCKDNVSNKKHLSELILGNGLDDILPLFKEDKDLLRYLEEFRVKLVVLYNELIQEIDNFYSTNKNLQRKDYAIKATSELGNKMSLAMNLYEGRDNGIADFIIKNKLYELI